MYKRTTTSLIFLLIVFPLSCLGQNYPDRWFFVSKLLTRDSDVTNIARIARLASEHNINGLVLSARLDRLDIQPRNYFNRLQKIQKICSDSNIEIIPLIFSAGYGGSILAKNKNLAAGLPVKDTTFVVRYGRAVLESDLSVKIENGGFENYRRDRFLDYDLQDKPGSVSFVDPNTYKSGKASLRFENFGKYRHGHARLMQEVRVTPYRCYKLSYWIKTMQFEPTSSLQMAIYGQAQHKLTYQKLRIKPIADWKKINFGFNSLDNKSVKVYIGAWGGKSGEFWLDDLELKEVALLNILRRPGTPLTVKDKETFITYIEGRDYAYVSDKKLNFKFDHEPPDIKILPNSRIKDGQKLLVSYYHGLSMKSSQVTICMSEPAVYQIWQKQAELIQKYLSPNKYMLSMDEIRAGGTCQACKNHNMTMSQILGDCITKQFNIIRKVNPDAQVYIWSDMLDPGHNARSKYYFVEGDLSDTWKYVPKDLIIVCWYHKNRQASLEFFSSKGFKTVAGAYYDDESLSNPKDWLDVMQHTPGARGIMYTTWKNKYDNLGKFGDIVAERNKSRRP